MTDIDKKYFLNGELWRIITPILLCILSFLNGWNIWIVNDFKAELEELKRTQVGHLTDPRIHYNNTKDIDWIIRQINLNHPKEKL